MLSASLSIICGLHTPNESAHTLNEHFQPCDFGEKIALAEDDTICETLSLGRWQTHLIKLEQVREALVFEGRLGGEHFVGVFSLMTG